MNGLDGLSLCPELITASSGAGLFACFQQFAAAAVFNFMRRLADRAHFTP